MILTLIDSSLPTQISKEPKMTTHGIRQCRHWYWQALLGTGVCMTSLVALATEDPTIGDNDMGEVAQHLSGQASSWKDFLWTGAQVAGIFIAIAGISMWIKAAKNPDGHHSHGKSAATILLGSAMFFLPTVMGVGASTLFGGN